MEENDWRPRNPEGWLFAIVVFFSAFLLFVVQPIMGKFLLPWFGGSPGVWTTCLVFFQAALLAGYGYAHLLTTRIPQRFQPWLHGLILVAAVFLLPITPSAPPAPAAAAPPAWQILDTLFRCLGLPFILLASTAPLLQRWRAYLRPDISPYRLYSLSNIGAIFALLLYPVDIEVRFSRTEQTEIWSKAFTGFALLSACVLWRLAARGGGRSSPSLGAEPPPKSIVPMSTRLLWLAFPACGCAMLVATTNKICQDIASVPFLWIAPLGIYLLTYVLTFDHSDWYHRGWIGGGLLASVLLVCGLLILRNHLAAGPLVTGYLVVLFLACMTCHGELARLKPDTGDLTLFYLTLAAGGSLGGLMAGLAAPLLFDRYYELQIAIVTTALILGIVLFRDPASPMHHGQKPRLWGGFAAIVVVGTVGMAMEAAESDRRVIFASRNFFGTLAIHELKANQPERRQLVLQHGDIVHGSQFTHPDLRAEPTAYFGRSSGAGLAFGHDRPANGRKIGAIGLGTGTIAAYGRPGDSFRFYELDPAVIQIARERFTYLEDSPADITLIPGDARLTLAAEDSQQFDIFILDAFSSDAIPVHLLTAEAFKIYARHLKPDGVIAVHVSNRHLDLAPVLRGAARHLDWTTLLVLDDPPKEDRWRVGPTSWMLLTSNKRFLALPEISEILDRPENRNPPSLRWTDEKTALLPILK